jgi:hypothetical protein
VKLALTSGENQSCLAERCSREWESTLILGRGGLLAGGGAVIRPDGQQPPEHGRSLALRRVREVRLDVPTLVGRPLVREALRGLIDPTDRRAGQRLIRHQPVPGPGATRTSTIAPHEIDSYTMIGVGSTIVGGWGTMSLIGSPLPLTIVPLSSRPKEKSAVVSAAASGRAIVGLLARSGTRGRVGPGHSHKSYDNTYSGLRLW